MKRSVFNSGKKEVFESSRKYQIKLTKDNDDSKKDLNIETKNFSEHDMINIEVILEGIGRRIYKGAEYTGTFKNGKPEGKC